jgi:CRP/FNR family transcriptional regulator, cyclic AMP receptor protein
MSSNQNWSVSSRLSNSVQYSQLLHCSLLEDLSDRQKKDFVDQCAARFHEHAETILVQGKPGAGVFLIARGRVEVSVQGVNRAQYRLFEAGPGEILGEIESVADRPCAATCRAAANSVTLFCDHKLFNYYLDSKIFTRNVFRIFYDRMARDNQAKIVDQSFTIEQKLCTYILQATTADRPILAQKQDSLADAMGCSRQRLNRALGALRKAGYIALKRGAIEALDRGALDSWITQPLAGGTSKLIL